MQQHPRIKQISAAVIGNAFEWYDFVVYGFMTLIIAKNFFPASSPYASLLLTTATFGVGFVMRPVGGILIGIYGDRKGRKAALQLIIGLMTVSMAIMALSPTYASIGIAAPILMLLARLLQGLATGGEFASATSYLVESAPLNRRGLYGSLQMFGQSLAVLFGAAWGTIVTQYFSSEQIDSFAFRLPFIFGLLIAPVGIYIRRYLDETPAFETSRKEAPKLPLRRVISTHSRGIAVTGGLTVSATIMFYVILVYMPTFANQHLQLPLKQAFIAQGAGLICMAVTVLMTGVLSDRIGRAPILACASGLYVVLVLPLFSWVMAEPTFDKLVAMQIMLCGLAGAYFGPLSTAVAEQFPVYARATGLAVGYNAAVMVFGGFASFAMTWLINSSGSLLAPAYYVMFGATIGFLASLFAEPRHADKEANYTFVEKSEPGFAG